MIAEESGEPVVISVIAPIELAIERVKVMLFKPFDMNKWFTVGFCAWLTVLCQGGVSFPFPFGNFNNPGLPLAQVRDFFSSHLLLITIFVSTGMLFGLAIMLAVLWVNCRGRFMFLYCVSQNKAEIKMPWHQFAEQADSLFFFKLVTGFIAFASLALCVAIIILMIVFSDRSYESISVLQIFAIACLCLIISVITVVFGVFLKFTNDFVIPIMYLDRCNCSDAWRKFLQIFSPRKWAFALYLLFKLVIGMVLGMILMAVIFGTCCCGACFLAIPYIGTVLMLPLLVFERAYCLYYLRQFGPAFDVFDWPIILPEPDVSGDS